MRVIMKDRLKRRLQHRPVLLGAARLMSQGVLGRSAPASIEGRIARRLGGKARVRFVQIGANDGVQGDPLYRTIIKNANWSGIFVEPMKSCFLKLKENYEHSERFIFENVAIGNEKGYRDFYYISERARDQPELALPAWADQLGSFDREHIVQHLGDRIDPFIETKKVECITFSDLVRKHNAGNIDLIHIDTEGFDYHILRQIDLNIYTPSIILFEHKHLTAEEKRKARDMLRSRGYRLTAYEFDTLAELPRRERLRHWLTRPLYKLRRPATSAT